MGNVYRKMLEAARLKGVQSEKAMWAGVDAVDELLDAIKDAHPQLWKHFVRKSHESMLGPHYNQCMADSDVQLIKYTGRDGKEHHGPYWTMEQIEAATKGKKFPESTTTFDLYVAYNAMYADLCQDETDESILRIAYRFYFQDEDAPAGKIWHYMTKMQEP